MKDPHTLMQYENAELKIGSTLIAGVDEVGRGPLAGPVVCASVIMDLDNLIDGVDDSKKLTEKKREELYDQILSHAKSVCIAEESEKEIDRINILNATKQCMKKAILGLNVTPNVVLIDAVKLEDLPIRQVSIIHGDALSYTIACASIVAKVYRDRLMTKLDPKYPEYNFKKHKGYGTAEHIRAIKDHGLCEIHRRSFTKKFIKEE